MAEKRFSATQYALLSSLFALPRIFAGPPSGLLADTLGWTNFFLLTVVMAIPGMVMLSRFVPWSQRELRFEVSEVDETPLMDGRALMRWTGLFGAISSVIAVSTLAVLESIKVFRRDATFPWAMEFLKIVNPQTIGDGLSLISAITAGLVLGLTLAAIWLTRGRGLAQG